MRKKIFALLLLCTALTAAAKVKLPALMGDNMVLQQQSDARLPGRRRRTLAADGPDARRQLYAV